MSYKHLAKDRIVCVNFVTHLSHLVGVKLLLHKHFKHGATLIRSNNDFVNQTTDRFKKEQIIIENIAN